MASTSGAKFILYFFFFFSLCLQRGCAGAMSINYTDALTKSLLFFEGQRSGKLPSNQRITWRSDSAILDGQYDHADLAGGYYDAGDNVKFNFPMAFSTTMLSWGVIEYGKHMGSELDNARAAIRWATDYLLKCATASQGKLYAGVGEPTADHNCWMRPEDMDGNRKVYFLTSSTPGSDLAAETAAALAAASLVFRRVDRKYADELQRTAIKVFKFADDYKGKYSDALGGAVCPFYCSYSGYQDELVWGAAWLLRLTNEPFYLNYIKRLGANNSPDIFSWDNKYAGANVLLSRRAVIANNPSYQQFKDSADQFMCKILPNTPYSSTKYTPGGLMYKLPESNLQYVTSISFLLTTYAKYMKARNAQVNCGGFSATRATLRQLAKRQEAYLLGANPLGMSYMVGYGAKYPQRIHHRGSSIPSIKAHRLPIGCNGFQYFNTLEPNPNILYGAVVGGPDTDDQFADKRDDYTHSEPAIYITGCLVGTLASFIKTS